MKDNYNYIDIRDWLDRWFDADLTPEQEKLLRRRILEAGSLPEDMEGDCRLFIMLTPPGKEDAIPSDLQSRINSALEREIRASRAHTFRRKARWAVAGVAVALFGVFLTPRLMEIEDIQEAELAEGSRRTQMMAYDTVRPLNSEIPLQIDAKPSDEGVPRRPAPRVFRCRKKNDSGSEDHTFQSAPEENYTALVSSSPEPAENADGTFYLSAEEEKILAARNYRVVRSSHEAEQILNSVLSSMENKIVVEEAKLSQISVDFENRVGLPSENVKPLNIPYHESQPI